MHIPDGFCSLPVCLATAALSFGAVGAGMLSRGGLRAIPAALPATATGFLFAAQMLNFPVGAGTSGHFLGAAAAAALFGPLRACLMIATILVVQTFVFADGGVTALGANLLNMGVLAGFGGYFIMRAARPLLPAGRKGYLASVAVGSWCSVILAAVACSIELALSGTLPLSATLPAMTGTHALIGLGEALITVAAVGTLSFARPELLPDWSDAPAAPARASSLQPAALTVGGIALLLAAMASPFASSAPDGLERVAADLGALDRARELWTLSPLKDYSIDASASAGMSTALAGVLGVMAVIAAAYALGRCFSGGKQAH